MIKLRPKGDILIISPQWGVYTYKMEQPIYNPLDPWTASWSTGQCRVVMYGKYIYTCIQDVEIPQWSSGSIAECAQDDLHAKGNAGCNTLYKCQRRLPSG